MTLRPDQHTLSLAQREEARQLIAAGKTLRQVAAHFGVSRMAIWRSMERHPDRMSRQRKEVDP
jgi:IS30 family transposase